MLVLRNTGASALHGIRMVTSGPDVYVSPDNADLSSPSADSVMPGKGPSVLFLNSPLLADWRSIFQGCPLLGVRSFHTGTWTAIRKYLYCAGQSI